MIVIIINIAIVIFPNQSIISAKYGLNIWFSSVLPSLLPFIIGCNLMIYSGVVKFISILIEPLTKKIFGVSGNGGFAFIMGCLSGYPMGAKIVSELRNKNEITKHEGEKLLMFVNNSGPLFILGVIGIEFLGNSTIGYYILFIHIFSSIITGIFANLIYKQKIEKPMKANFPKNNKNIIYKAYLGLKEVTTRENNTIGEMLGKSVYNSMETILQIGGFIVLFVVVNKMLESLMVYDYLNIILSPINKLLGFSSEYNKGILSGILEMSNGIKQISLLPINQTSIVCIILLITFAGFSIHAQSLSFICKTDINPMFYFGGKLINTFIAFVLSIISFPFFKHKLLTAESVEVFSHINISFINKLLQSLKTFSIAIFLLIIFSLLINLSFKRKARNS